MRGILFATLLFAMFTSCAEAEGKKDQKPNIIYILADDLGIGDLSIYGQEKFVTPNIDKLADDGMLFTQHYSGSTVCAPSRSTLMTGLHTGHTPIRGNKELTDQEGQTPLPSETVTIADMLRKAGYTTGAFGKWGLGYPGSEGDPNNQGFDVFYGYNCQRMAHRYYPEYVWDNQKKDYLKGNDWSHTVTYAPDVIQEKTLEFIENNSDRPFFAYVPLIQPHAELLVPDDSIFAKFKGKFEEPDNFEQLQTYASDYGPDMILEKYSYQKYPRATFASMVYRIDVYVGQILAKLEELGIADNTIVIFTSDNGPHAAGGADPEYFNSSGGLRGIKRDLYEGGIRTPFIVTWPGKIAQGSQSDHISAFWDMMPTFADIAKITLDVKTDGVSMLPTLLGKGEQKQHNYLYWEFAHKGGRQAVRMGNWKGVLYGINNKQNPEIELYDLATDPFEKSNVANENPKVVAQIKEIMTEAHVPSSEFPLINK